MTTQTHTVTGQLADAVASIVFADIPKTVLSQSQKNHFPAMEWCVLTFFNAGSVCLPYATSAAPAGEPLPRWLLSGPRTKPVTSTVLQPITCIGVLLYPHALPRLTGVFPDEILDDDLNASAILPPAWAVFTETLEALSNAPCKQLKWIKHWLTQQWVECCRQIPRNTSEGLPHLLRESVRNRQDETPTTISEWARSLQISERHLQRLSAKSTGFSPIQLQRIQRAQNAFLRARKAKEMKQPVNLAELALSCGYSDQAHLTREFRALCGLPAARLLNAVETDNDFWPFRL